MLFLPVGSLLLMPVPLVSHRRCRCLYVPVVLRFIFFSFFAPFLCALLLKNNLYVSWKFWIFHFIMYITFAPHTIYFCRNDWTHRTHQEPPKAKATNLNCAKCWKIFLMICCCYCYYWLLFAAFVQNVYSITPFEWRPWQERERESCNNSVYNVQHASHIKFFHMNHHPSSFISLHFIQIHTPFL